MPELKKGSCLCGKVHFETRGPLRGIVYCHCSQCRKQSGHHYAATGQDNISWYEASEFARRGFCKHCGSVLFWKHNELDYISVMAGAFDNPSGLHGKVHIFVGDKGDYYKIDDGLPQYVTGREAGILVAPSSED
jgi:hypothetical protein